MQGDNKKIVERSKPVGGFLFFRGIRMCVCGDLSVTEIRSFKKKICLLQQWLWSDEGGVVLGSKDSRKDSELQDCPEVGQKNADMVSLKKTLAFGRVYNTCHDAAGKPVHNTR